jgi:hypothetical protein
MPLGAAWWLSFIEVELLIGCGGSDSYQVLTNSECYKIYTAVSPWVLRPMDERERTQTNS